jgi:hypothetical protein
VAQVWEWATSSMWLECSVSHPTTPIWFKLVSIFGLFYLTTVAAVHILLTMPRSLAPEPHRCSEFLSRSRDLRYAVIREGTLSWQLHTAPLPAPHVPVGYR